MQEIKTTVVLSEEIKKQSEYIRLIKEETSRCGPKKYKLVTFGCQMNENDSEKLAGMLDEMGYTCTENVEESDLVIFNTCCVRKNAESKVYGRLGELKKIKAIKPELIIAVCGCMTQQKEVTDHIKKKYPYVDLVFGTHNLHRFPELFYNAVRSGENVFDVWQSEGSIAEGVPIKRKEGVKALVTIMYGCNNFCSYCIVPYVRGRERSRQPEDILREISLLGRQGCKEITLLGQNVNSYGKDLQESMTFSKLLYEVDKVPGIERIRFMTSHPKDLSDDLIGAMKECKKVCEHLHLPVQAGSSRVLEAMNRKYTKGQYIDLVSKIKDNVPGISLTTDIIVGFPGESDDDFEDTLDVVEKVRFDMAYTFMYSKRAGTPAAKDPAQVPDEVKKERFERLVEVQNRISREINDTLLGSVQEVLVEGFSKTNKNMLTGRTRTNKIVNFKGSEKLIGSLADVEITESLTWSLKGRAKQ